MVGIKEINYVREVTHMEYTFMSDAAKKVGILNKVDKVITDKKWIVDKKNFENRISSLNQKYMVIITDQTTLPVWGGGVFFILLLSLVIGAIKFPEDIETLSFITWSLFSLLGFLFFLIYFFTKPKKEKILNREQGLITFPGFMWHKNITMFIHDVVFAYSQPSAQGIGAYQLRVVRPDKMFSQALMSFGGTCYEDLSLIIWYMDKNRPLPPGDAFDEFREQDYKRRRSEGFPKPLFPARFDTPEATAEQQAERERIGGW